MKLGTKINIVLVTVVTVILTIGFWVITDIEAKNIKNQVIVDTDSVINRAHQDVERMFTQISSQKDSLEKVLGTLSSRIPRIKNTEVVDTKGNVITSTRAEADIEGKLEKQQVIQDVESKKEAIFKMKDSGSYYEIEYSLPVFNDRNNIIGIVEIEAKTLSKNSDDLLETKRLLSVSSASIEQNVRTIYLAIEDGSQYLQKIVDDASNFGKIDDSTPFGFIYDFVIMDSNLVALVNTRHDLNETLDDTTEYVKARKDVVSGELAETQYERVRDGHALIVEVKPIKVKGVNGDRIVGVIEIQILKSSYEGRINDLRMRMLGMGVVFTIVLVIVLAFILEREVVGPIRRYSFVARKIADGDFNQKVEHTSNNEIGQFGEVFNSMVANLRELDKLKSDFISVAAHQLRTPLSGVKWVLKLILDGDLGEITESQKGMLKRGYETNEKMIQLVNDLLNVSRIENGNFGYKFERNDFTKLINLLIENTVLPSKERNIEVRLENRAGQLPEFLFDPEKLLIALQNIVDNAMKYTFPGGKVTIDVNRRGEYVEIKISDTGVGIPKQDLPKLFSKFFRATNVIHLQTDGSGLGLFIVKSIIMRHGGQIWVDSVEGKGSTFTVLVPLEPSLIPKDDIYAPELSEKN